MVAPRVKQPKRSAKDLTDEQVLKEFVKRFQCDGAVLIYYEGGVEYGFGRWVNSKGRKWINLVFDSVKNKFNHVNDNQPDNIEGGETKQW